MLITLFNRIRNKIYHPNDNNFYYGEFKGTLTYWKLILFNLLFPGRFFNQLKFGQVKYFNYIKNKYIKSKPLADTLLNQKFFELNENGSITIESYFSEKIIDDFKNEYKDEIFYLKNKNSDVNEYFKNSSLKIKNSLIKIWLDKNIIKLIESYMCAKLYARNYPTLNFSLGKSATSSRFIHKVKKTNVTDVWHVDHSTLISCHIFLEDIDKNGTCMEYVRGTNKYFNTNFAVSDEVIKKSNLSVAQCFGKKGSVNIHCGNVIHKMRPKPESNRLMLTFGFTAGSNINLDVNCVAKCLSSNFDLDSLDQKNRNLLQGIFPINQSKGYNIKKNGKLEPTSFRGI